MEKLQPLIKHKFWVITGAVLLLAIAGWWISTSAKAALIQQRWDTLAALSVPSGSGTPNEIYIEGIDRVNQVLDKNQDVLDNRLYESQKNLRTWPQHVAKFMEGKLFGESVDYNVRAYYASGYRREILDMLAAVPQYQYDEITGAETGQVEIYPENMPHIIPFGTWKDNPPTSQVMWDAEEDVWLTRAILDAIKKVNRDAGATKISDAVVRSIPLLQLRGGSRSDGTATGTSGGEMDGGNYGEMMSSGVYSSQSYQDGGEMDYDGGGYGGGGGSITFKANITINLDSVLGPEGLQMTTGEGDASTTTPPMMSGQGQGKRRYVDDDPSLPYKTRGFYIEVLMLHDKLPDLQAALVSMPWPTELLMIHQVSDKQDEILAVKTESNQKNHRPPGRGGPRINQRLTPGPRGRTPFGSQGRTPFGSQGRPPFGGAGRSGGSRFGNPMGGYNPMGGFNPMDNYESDAGAGGFGGEYNPGNRSAEAAVSSYEKAMNDFYLAKIGIAGLMTIYRSPQEQAAEEAAAEQPAAPPAETTPEPTVDPETGKQIDPDTGKPIEPLIDPDTGKPIDVEAEMKAAEPEEPATNSVPMETPNAGDAPPASENGNPAPMPAAKSPPANQPAPGEAKPPAGEPPAPDQAPPPSEKPAPPEN